MEEKIRLSLFTRWSVQCGISVYSRYLLEALQQFPEIGNVHLVEAPHYAGRVSTPSAIKRFFAEERRFAQLGRRMEDEGTNIAHLQHQYFFFGGVAPHKNHTRAFLDGVRVPLVVTAHEIALPKPEARLLTRKAIEGVNRANFLHPNIARILVHTEQDQLHLLEMGIPEERLRVVRHGVPAVAPLPERETSKQRLGLVDRWVVTLFGYLSNKKGHGLALEAMRYLPEDIVLVFAGGRHPDDETGYVDSLRARTQELGLEARVRFTGYLEEEEVQRYLAVTDVAIAPFRETSGSGSLALLMAHGLPVLCSPIAPHAEILQDTPNSISLLPTLEPRAVAEHLEKVLGDSVLRSTLRQSALRYAERHSYRAMAQETLRVYREVLSGK